MPRNDDRLVCPRRPIIMALDNAGKEVPLNSDKAYRHITRFGRCLGDICMHKGWCKNGFDSKG